MLLQVDLITAFYGCLYVGVVPVTIRPPHPQNLQTTLPTVRMIVDVSKSAIILSSAQVILCFHLIVCKYFSNLSISLFKVELAVAVKYFCTSKNIFCTPKNIFVD